MRILITALAMLLLVTVAAMTAHGASLPYNPTIDDVKARIAELNPPDKDLPDDQTTLNYESQSLAGEIGILRNSAYGADEQSRQANLINNARTTISQSFAEIEKTDCAGVPEGPFIPANRISDVTYDFDNKISRKLLADGTSPWSGAPWKQESNIKTSRFCVVWKQFIGDKANQDRILSYYDNLLVHAKDDAQKQSDLQAEFDKLTPLLQQRRDAIEKRISAINNKAKITDSLWLLIVVISVFSILAILAVKLFSERIQIEWVATGQVIQFVTVMILLSVVMTLGLAEILKENTLGTLLGGIGGYVLAQGVGRAAAREVSRANTPQENEGGEQGK